MLSIKIRKSPKFFNIRLCHKNNVLVVVLMLGLFKTNTIIKKKGDK